MRGRSQLLELLRGWDERSEAVGQAEIVEALGVLDLERDDLSDALAFHERAYSRVAIRRRAHYEALVLCWRSGQSSPIHDHSGSSCVVRVVEGCATETRYKPTPCGQLLPLHSRAYPAGAVIGSRGPAIHQLANLESPGSELITLHIYSPPPSGWRFYSLDKTTLIDHDRLILKRPETIFVDFRHSVPGAPVRRKVRRGLPWRS